MLIPGFCKAWPNATTASFVVHEDGLGLSLAPNVTITLPVSPDDKHPEFPAVLKEFTVSVEVDVLKFETYTEKETQKDVNDDGAAYTAWCRATHFYSITLGTNGKGDQTLVYNEVGSPTETHGITESASQQELERIEIILTVVASIVLAILTDGISLAVSLAVLGILTGVDQIETKLTTAANNDDAPGMDMLVLNATAPITWTDDQDFKLTSAGLNGCLQLGGTME
jgi:hypothetical protein